MKIQAFVVPPQGRPPSLNVLGIQITVLAPNTATGAYEITLQEGDEGAGPPPHCHGWDESFFVTRGAVEFDCAGRTELATASTLVHGARRIAEPTHESLSSAPDCAWVFLVTQMAHHQRPQMPLRADLRRAPGRIGAPRGCGHADLQGERGPNSLSVTKASAKSRGCRAEASVWMSRYRSVPVRASTSSRWECVSRQAAMDEAERRACSAIINVSLPALR